MERYQKFRKEFPRFYYHGYKTEETEFTYKITYDLNGGLSSRRNPKSYTYFSDTIHLLPATKPGYEFVGWFDERGNELNVIREHSMGNKHLIAQFRKRELN